MHPLVFDNIDTLIKMANPNLSVDEVNMELISVKRDINNKNNEIEDLKSIMNDARYFNVSNELVDKNIEISLKNKISRLNKRIKEISNHISETKTKEDKLYQEINELKNNLANNQEYVNVIDMKANNSSNDYYKEMLIKENKTIKTLEENLALKTSEHDEILKELELNNQAYNELSDKLEKESDRLKDIMENLANPNSYLNSDLKESDEEKLATLNKELQDLEKRKLELITDPNIIANDAKELILNNDYTSALTKIKELVTIVKTKPYMEIVDESLLKEELAKLEQERDSLANLIDSKNYNEEDTNLINKRINYLKEEKETLKNNIATYEAEIKYIDDFVSNNLAKNIDEIENTLLNTIKSINDLDTLLNNNKNSRSKASTINTINKKEKEKNILNRMLNNYKEDLLNKISRTNILTKLINRLEDIISNYDLELSELEKESMLDLRTKDIIDIESDKDKLKQVNEDIKALKNRSNYTKTPDEIYDEIEMYFANIGDVPTNNKKKIEPVEIEELVKPKKIKVVEMIPVQAVKKDSTLIGGN